MDEIDLEILRRLQVNARLSLSELGRFVHLSQSAVSERVRKLEDRGVIQGYGARIDTAKLGLPLLAFVRVRHVSSDNGVLSELIEGIPEIVECHHVTGGDWFIFKLAAQSMEHLEWLTKRVRNLGPTTTSVVYSTPLANRPFVARQGTTTSEQPVGPSGEEGPRDRRDGSASLMSAEGSR